MAYVRMTGKQCVTKLAYICSMFAKIRWQTQIVSLNRIGLCFLRTFVFRTTEPCRVLSGVSTHHITGVIMQKPTIIKFTARQIPRNTRQGV